jgi:iron-sulfur cluster assembly accessory protein
MLSITNAAAARLSLKLCKKPLEISSSLTFQKVNSDTVKKSEYNRFRIAVKGGGCSGYQYKFSIDKCIESDDIILSSPEVAFEIVIDIHSFPLLEDITLDHASSLAGENFFITNPNAKISCGCGNSFAT